MKNITLYHGTSTLDAEAILKQGFDEHTCFTSNEELAEYFALARLDELKERDPKADEDIAILMITLPLSLLVVDYPAYEEPLSHYRNHWVDHEDDWHEGCDDGSIPYPNDQFDAQTALKVTTCVRCQSRVPHTAITVYA